MKKIIALAGSNSKESINKQFAYYVSELIEGVDLIQLDLNDFEVPMYGIDEENENGMPKDAQSLTKLIQKADGIVISLAEHNGSYTAVFKNIFDWISRIEAKVFETTPVLLLSTSSGGRAGSSVMQAAMDRFPRHGATIPANFSLPSFYDNFKDGKLVDENLLSDLKEKITLFEEELKS
ncbi:NAD(P)H-dependent oxidoreductase [Flavobacteriales bacterium]|nr:NAD(P)H-dependent oxidoreductase [Flavobacteriales bacterium]MDB4195402.1 NAD(P)H-dependent oxidoreductase [Flavobacteriales bacterium]